MILPVKNFGINFYKNNITKPCSQNPVKTFDNRAEPKRALPFTSLIYFTSNAVKKQRENSYVIGHPNPDTDSVASAIAYSYLINKKEDANYVPISAGELKSETKFALNHFGVIPPRVIKNFETRIMKIMTPSKGNKAILNSDATIKSFGDLILNHNVRSAIIVDKGKNRNLLGMVSDKDLAKVFLSTDKNKLAEKEILFNAIKNTLEADVLVGGNLLKKHLSGKLIVGASDEENVSSRLSKDDLLIVGNREEIQKDAIKKGVAGIILTGGQKASSEITNLASKNGVIILSSPLDTYSTAKSIEHSIPIRKIMSLDPQTIDVSAKVDEIRKNIEDYPYRLYPVLSNGVVVGTVKKEDILNPPKNKFILVDHNSPSQFADGIENSDIVGVVDHHSAEFRPEKGRIPMILSDSGASATLVYREFLANSVKIPRNIAGLLLCAIISDTDNFTSPTTTFGDRQAASELAKISKITSAEVLAKQLLTSREEDLKDMTTRQALNYDFKKYETQGGKSFSISQVITHNPDLFLCKAEEIYSNLDNLDTENRTDGALFVLTNSIDNSSYIFSSGKFAHNCEEFIRSSSEKAKNKAAFGEVTTQDMASLVNENKKDSKPVLLENVSSRKEQVEPFVRGIY